MSLIILALMSGASISLGTFNYVDFFSSLGRLTLRAESLTSELSQTGIEYHIAFVLENPSRYQGLGVKGFGSDLEIRSKDGASVIPYGSIEIDASGSLPPYSDLRIQGRFAIIGRGADLLRSLQETQGANFHLESTVELHTFLEPSFGLAISFRCVTHGEPTICETVSTDITAYGSGPVVGT